MRVGRRLGPALLLVLCVAPDLAAHDEGSFDKRRATAGIKLELIELAGPPDAGRDLGDRHASGRVTNKRGRVSTDGQLPPHLITHVASDAERGARYAVKGRACEVALEYSWGEPALVRR